LIGETHPDENTKVQRDWKYDCRSCRGGISLWW